MIVLFQLDSDLIMKSGDVDDGSEYAIYTRNNLDVTEGGFILLGRESDRFFGVIFDSDRIQLHEIPDYPSTEYPSSEFNILRRYLRDQKIDQIL